MEFPYEVKVVPIEGLYYGFTLDGKEICAHVLTLKECERRIAAYQRANGNPMCTIRRLIPMYGHHSTVMPIKESELNDSPASADKAAGGA